MWFELLVLLVFVSLWFRDMLREAVFEGACCVHVLSNARVGIVLFILSEVALFGGVF